MPERLIPQAAGEPPVSLVLGVPFHRTTIANTLADCDAAIEAGGTHYITTPNMDHCNQCFEDDELRDLVFHSHRVVCDGEPLVWLSRWFGVPLAERVAGSDLIPQLIRQCAERGRSLYFFGSDDETLRRAKEILEREHPTLRIKGCSAPPMGQVHEWDNEAIVEEIRSLAPDVLLVALGCPKQERWCLLNQEATGVPLAIGIGAGLDFIAGKQVRAPRWMHRLGMEWLWRMATDPKRLVKRYAQNWVFLLKMLRTQWRMTTRSPGSDIGLLESGERTLVDGSSIGRPSSQDLSKLASLARRNDSFCIVGASPALRSAIARLKLTRQLPCVDTVEAADRLFERRHVDGTDDPARPKCDITRETVPQILERLRANGTRTVIDLSDVRFMDSAAAATLKRASNIELRSPQPPVRRLLSRLALDEMVHDA